MRNTMSALLAARAARRNRGRGIGLVELALALAIGALLVAGAVVYFSNASTAQKTNDAMSQLTAIQQVVRSLYAGQPDYDGLVTSVVAQSKQLPSKYIKGTGATATVTSPFNSGVTVAASTAALPVNFSVAFAGVPDQACTKMATTDFGTALVSVQVNSTTAQVARPYTPTLANTGCTGNANTITWIFN